MTTLVREYKGDGEFLSVHHPDTPGALDDAPDALCLIGAIGDSLLVLKGSGLRIFTALFLLAVVASILGVHFLGRRRADSVPKPTVAPIESKQGTTEPKVAKADYYEPAKPAEPPKSEVVEEPKPPPPPKPVEPEHFLELIDGYAADDAIRKSQLFFLPCNEGPSNARYSVFPVNPKEALNVGSMAVIVAGFDSSVPFVPDSKPEPKKPEVTKTEPKKTTPPNLAMLAPQGSTIYGYRARDNKRMGIGHLAVYALENVGGKPRLSFEGTVDILEYRRFFPIREDSGDKGSPTDFLDIHTPSSGLRRKRVFPTKCVGGPADGNMYPLLVSPSILWEKGLTTIAITDVAFRPKEYSFADRGEKRHTTNFMGHVSLYALEGKGDHCRPSGSFSEYQLKFTVALDASTYLKIHNQIEEQ